VIDNYVHYSESAAAYCSLTLSSPVVSNGYTSKCSAPYWSNLPFLIFWHSGILALRAGRQSVRMSKNLKG